jgi:SAM-dependent methyltransferase
MQEQWSYPGRELESMAFAVNYHRWILDIFRPYLGKRIVEVGAGSGSFSELLLETRPERLDAIEPSANMFPLLADHLQHIDSGHIAHAHQGTLIASLEALRSAGTPDSVIYVNVLEHVENDAAELAAMHSLLQPRGHALIFVPANPWLMGSMDRELGHFRRYTMKDLRQKCEKVGFTVKLAHYFDLLGIAPWWLKYCLLQSKTMEPAAVRLYDRFVVPTSRVFESVVRPPIGKNIVLVAAKSG